MANDFWECPECGRQIQKDVVNTHKFGCHGRMAEPVEAKPEPKLNLKADDYGNGFYEPREPEPEGIKLTIFDGQGENYSGDEHEFQEAYDDGYLDGTLDSLAHNQTQHNLLMAAARKEVAREIKAELDTKNTLKMKATPGESFGLMLTNTDYEEVFAKYWLAEEIEMTK